MEIVVLRTFDNYFSANILLTRMRDAGVECYLKDEYTVTIDPLLSNAIGGIKLFVKKQDVTFALEVLAGFELHQKAQDRCPNCGSHDIISAQKGGAGEFIRAISAWLFSTVDVHEHEYKCNTCGKQYDDSNNFPDIITEGDHSQ